MRKKKEFLKLGATGTAILADLEKDTTFEGQDRYFVVAIARMLEIASEADKEIYENGTIQEFQNGTRQVSPQWTIFKTSIADAQKIAWTLNKLRSGLVNDPQAEEKPTMSITHLIRKAK